MIINNRFCLDCPTSIFDTHESCKFFFLYFTMNFPKLDNLESGGMMGYDILCNPLED